MFSNQPSKYLLPKKQNEQNNSKDERKAAILKTAKEEKAKLEQQKKDKRKARREAKAKAMSTIPGLDYDILRLKKVFQLSGRHDWQGFEEAVRKTHFNLLYSGINSYYECVQYTEKLFKFCLPRWFEARTFSDAVFGFYLVSTIYYIQPVKDDVKIRVGLDHVDKMTKFLIVCQSTKNIQTEFLLMKMVLVDHCFEFTENPQQAGLLTKNIDASVPVGDTLPSKIVSLAQQFDTILASYKRTRDAVLEEDPSLPASGRDLDYNFVADFVEAPSSSFVEKPKDTETQKDDIGQRRKALKEKAFSSVPKSATKFTSEQQEKPSGSVNYDESDSSDDEEWLVTIDYDEIPDDAGMSIIRKSIPARNPELKKLYDLPIINDNKCSRKKVRGAKGSSSVAHSSLDTLDDLEYEDSDFEEDEDVSSPQKPIQDSNKDGNRASPVKTKDKAAEQCSSSVHTEAARKSKQSTPVQKSKQVLPQSMPIISPEETLCKPKKKKQKAAS